MAGDAASGGRPVAGDGATAGRRVAGDGARAANAGDGATADGRIADAAAIALAIFLALAATLVGVRTGWHPADADEIVFRETLTLMRHGESFYRAQAAALIAKEHRPPTSIRAIRPPTLYLALRWVPPDWWRWLVGLIYLADLLLVWRLARAHGPPAGVLSVVLSGVWLLGFAPYLFLHAEVWGLPFFLAGLLFVRQRQAGPAVCLILIASCIRELYAVGLVAGCLFDAFPLSYPLSWRVLRPHVGPWVVGIAAVLSLYAVHAVLAETVLVPVGYNARFGNEQRSVAFILRLLAPISSGPGELLGVAMTGLGILGALRVARWDRASLVAMASSMTLLIASIWATRVYWSACWALPLAAFAPVAVPLGRRRSSSAEPSVGASELLAELH